MNCTTLPRIHVFRQGIMVNRYFMRPVERYLLRPGYEVRNRSYRTTGEYIELELSAAGRRMEAMSSTRHAPLACVLLVTAWVRPAGAQEDCGRFPVHVFFQEEPRGSSCERFDGAVDGVEVPIPTGLPSRRHTVAAALHSEIGGCHPGLCQDRDPGPRQCEPGVQGWSLSIAAEGDLTLVGANIKEANPQLTCPGAFLVVHLVDPARPGPDGLPQGQGVISAVVFLCIWATVLNPGGTETALGITLEGERPPAGGSRSGTLRCRDGLAFALPVENVATVDGASGPFCSCRGVGVRFTAVEPVPFRRCDPNDDGALDVSDPLALLGWLFLTGEAPPCRPAADCNADREVNVTDAVYALLHLFHGGPPPPAPFPACGLPGDPLELCDGMPDACSPQR
jgi:hypothetical protein